MEITFFISFMAFLVCFLATLVSLRQIWIYNEKQPLTSSWKQNIFLPVLSITSLVFVAFFIFGNNPQDQIFRLGWAEFSATLISFIIISVFFLFKEPNRVAFFLLTFLVIFCTLLLPSDFTLFQNNLPFWIDRFCIVILWLTFAWFFQYLNGIDGMAPLQASGITFGLIIVFILGGLPTLYGNFSASFLGTLTAILIYNWYPAKLMLKDGACISLGFLLGWMLLLTAQEGMGGSALIFITYYALELLWALGNKLVSDKGDFIANTLYYQTNISGLSPAITCQSISKLLTILLVLGSFQVYAPNNYSLPIVSAFITLWFMNKLHNWQNQPQSLKEINQEVIQNIKNNVDNIKKIIR